MERKLFLVCLMCMIASSLSVHYFDVYRVAQFDNADGGMFGSRKSVLNKEAITVPPIPEVEREVSSPSATSSNSDLDDDFWGQEEVDDGATEQSASSKKGATSDLGSQAVVLKMKDLTTSQLEDLADYRKAAGIVILLPTDLDSIPKESIAHYRKVEQYILSRGFDLPVYFAFSDDELEVMHHALESNSEVDDKYQLKITPSEATLLPSFPVTNFHGWVYSSPRAGVHIDSSPTIAIVSNYDSFGAAPGLAYGLDQSGSSTVALLELARIFSRLYSDIRTQGSINVLFILTGAARFNYAGSKQWLKSIDPRVLETVDFALCLDSLASSDDLYLHVSRKAKSPIVQRLYSGLNDTATNLGINFEIIHKKINISDPNIGWQHEQFARKRIVSATLSSQRSVRPNFQGSSIFDRKSNVDTEVLARNIKFVAEALCRYIYDYSENSSNLQVIAGSDSVNSQFIENWIDFLGSNARVVPLMEKHHPVLTQLEKSFQASTQDSRRSGFALESHIKFYKGTSVAQMASFTVRPATFYLGLLGGVVAYLGVLHVSFKWMSSD